MRSYELVLVLRTSLKAAERKKLIDNVKNLLKGLRVVKENELGKKALSYPIKKEKEGDYMTLILEGESVIPNDFEKRLITEEDILRHLILRTK